MRRVWLLLGALAVFGTACAQQGASPSSGGGDGGGVAGAPQGDAGPGEAVQGAPGAAAPSIEGLPPLSPTVIRNANLEVQVDRDGLSEALDGATNVAVAYGGFVVSSAVQGEDSRTGSLVIRVPAQRFDAAMTDLRQLGRIEEERISSEEVGSEFVDLEARRRNLEAQERQMLQLMGEASTISDTIRVQQVLERIQLEIERIEGRLRYLEDQTALATISLHLVEEGAPVSTSQGAIARAWDAAVEGFVLIIAALVVVLGYTAPFAIGAGIVLLVYFRMRRGRPGPAPTG
jgi:Domain of unknown function (DUF4349)